MVCFVSREIGGRRIQLVPQGMNMTSTCPTSWPWATEVNRRSRDILNYPLVMTNSLLLKMVIYSGFTHWTWWFSIVFCMFTRGHCQLLAFLQPGDATLCQRCRDGPWCSVKFRWRRKPTLTAANQLHPLKMCLSTTWVAPHQNSLSLSVYIHYIYVIIYTHYIYTHIIYIHIIYIHIIYIYIHILYIHTFIIYIHYIYTHLYASCIPILYTGSFTTHPRGLARRAVISLWSSKCLPFPLSHICWTLPRPEAPNSRPWNSLHGWMRREFSFFVADFIAREFSSPLASLNSHVKFLVAPFLVHWNSAWKLLTGDQGRTFIYSRQNCGKHPERVTAPDRTVPCFHLASPPCASCQSQRDGIHWKRQNGSSFFKWPLYQEGGITIQTLWICDPEPKLLSADTRSAQLCLGQSGQPRSASLSLSLQAAWDDPHWMHSSWMGPQALKAGGASIAVTACHSWYSDWPCNDGICSMRSCILQTFGDLSQCLMSHLRL